MENRKAKETVYKKKLCKKGGEKRIKMSRKLFFFNSQLPSKLSNPIRLYVTSYIKTNMFLFNRKIENSKKMSIENKKIRQPRKRGRMISRDICVIKMN